ncbi:MAG: riboflavin biosynthesis protein RibF [Zetaproteobacteria bacterium CG_4_9_14_3_um_filter_49_83]|nr:MAG: riboflavin biosynthesis protein RibF [Zetaproteobacteria bacterium CG1_02_49_23]PIQ33153.1 MAG: riboflavin biosynthesis protein RibF [Zetaproteobacteria bacterium CG17_big_fil_post_rev_8_21_14_2_50_50_13]PIV29357.1 MAG: riboflavin biosynthesis protein RibF [Zetaproteobacteria bacterium CG02_land_8_20_14_3_00_50_9]PIY54791.1 MAG: riboflavin biosynthesis protein RibF [Zetaproteobacteria bacterium CG_4_10_14_0_8_um_filter_49_80]PJA33682.1 MAG: riboflavin biosynthesis protein RibF [Zetaprot
MKIFSSWQEASEDASVQHGAMTVGNFDGVHMGHQQILAELRGHAEAVKGPAIAVTFEPHPRAVLFPQEAPRRLCHLHERLAYLEEMALDAVLLLPFTKHLAQWTAEEFSRKLYEAFSFRHFHVGYDFAFGRDRMGHIDDLRRYGETAGFTVTEAAAFEMADAVVSSSRIRSVVEAADFTLAAHLLGRDYAITGKVQHGDERGRTMNFPTVNMDVADLSHPPVGIYAVQVESVDSGEQWGGAAYLGFRPTFNGRTLLLETHVFDVERNFYDQELRVTFVARLREDRTFSNHAELAGQIAEDCKRAKIILAEKNK